MSVKNARSFCNLIYHVIEKKVIKALKTVAIAKTIKDGPGFGFAYSKDFFKNQNNLELFYSKYGYELSVPKNIQEINKIIDTFQNQDGTIDGAKLFDSKDWDSYNTHGNYDDVIWCVNNKPELPKYGQIYFPSHLWDDAISEFPVDNSHQFFYLIFQMLDLSEDLRYLCTRFSDFEIGRAHV